MEFSGSGSIVRLVDAELERKVLHGMRMAIAAPRYISLTDEMW
jgi:hypothetical protein